MGAVMIGLHPWKPIKVNYCADDSFALCSSLQERVCKRKSAALISLLIDSKEPWTTLHL
jgi:hypothetical protein